jgi:hypothetical protein
MNTETQNEVVVIEVVEQAELAVFETAKNEDDNIPNFVTFSTAARILNARYQQVYSRAVTKNKMRYEDVNGLYHVHIEDLHVWYTQRKAKGLCS